MYLGSVAFSEAAFGDEGSLDVTVSISGVQANGIVGSISIAGNTGVELPTQVATFSINPPTINSDANITITASLVATTQLGTLTSIVGDANVTPASTVLNGTIGIIGITGDANVSVALFVGSGELEATAVVDTTGLVITADANVTPPSLVATGSIGTLTFTGDANVELPLSNALYGTSRFNDNEVYGGGGGLVATVQVGTPIVNSDANVDAPSFVATTQLGTLVGITGDANVTPTSVVLNGSIGILTFQGDANLTLTDSLVATTQIGTLGIVGTATLTLPSLLLQTTFNAPLITTISQNDYAKDRTVIIPVRQHKVRSQNQIGQQSRTVIIPPRRHIAVTTNIAA